MRPANENHRSSHFTQPKSNPTPSTGMVNGPLPKRLKSNFLAAENPGVKDLNLLG